MFEPQDAPRLFALPPGADFPARLIDGVLARLAGQPPEALARVEIFVNTRRMQRRMREILDSGPPRLLPRIRLVTELADLPDVAAPAPVPALRRRLELTQLISALMDRADDLAPRSSLFALADSLAGLMDEMQAEGVTPDHIEALDPSNESEYWQRSLQFVRLVETYFRSDTAPDAEARQRRAADRLAERWREEPPRHPVIVAGSTGSRGPTAVFMRAVARLPQGALVLPGFDFDLPGAVWERLDQALTGEDHPQFRFARLLHDLGARPGDVAPWTEDPPPSPPRNRLISLALRPAPVTDQWMTEGRRLTGLDEAAAGMTLIEAPNRRLEAAAVALALRKAAEDGRKAALITPDRELTRQVTAALDRWGILPDDSAGQPLPLTAPGRFLRHVAELFGQRLTAEALLTLLKHPLTNTGSGTRGDHLRHTRDLELHIRRKGLPFPETSDVLAWAGKESGRQDWSGWLAQCLSALGGRATRTLAAHVAAHRTLAETLAAGPSGMGSGALWEKQAGEKALEHFRALEAEAGWGGTLSSGDYAALFQAVLQRGEVRGPEAAHPDIMIWGTLEARVQGADLVILGGLNDGVWPAATVPDPWLNRKLRDAAGLLLPERRIGLAAHDFQQAVAAREVILTRSVRDAEAETVPSRWLNRLLTLMSGVSEEGDNALKGMQARGNYWLRLTEVLDRPDPAAPALRPSPRPPVQDRPRKMSITEVQTLIRDPYAVYARRILQLKPLDPLRQLPDAPVRGTILHRVLEKFVGDATLDDPDAARARLIEIAEEVLSREAPWPAAQRIWRAKLIRVADWFVPDERARRSEAVPIALEREGEMAFPLLDLTLTGKVDRIDRRADGSCLIYDYKTGQLPTTEQQKHFDKQLMLAAMMLEAGALRDLPAAPVSAVGYIGLGASPKVERHPVESGDIAEARGGFEKLLAAYRQPDRGYTARRAMEKMRFAGHYDHLARYGEWDETDRPEAVELGR